ncbi:MAG: M81 family metallopeptidase [Thermostichus sp. BF3_bins_97]
MRIAIGGIAHETNTFSIVPTKLEDFQRSHYAVDEGLLTQYTGTKTGLGGFIDAACNLNYQVFPTLMASATPGGIVTSEALAALVEGLTTRLGKIHAEAPLDGIFLTLHGAMVSELDDDGESYILRAVRQVVGPEMPIIVELDLHGNITPEMVSLVSICVAYDEYPHTDPYERGYEAGVLMAKMVRGGIQPTPHIINIPLLSGMQRQYTHAEPMLGLKRLAHDIETERGILNVSYLPGFPYADIPHTSFTIIVTSDGDPELAKAKAQELAAYVWERRDDFVAQPVSTDEAVMKAIQAPAGPIVLADSGDNPGAGTPCDGTVLLEALLRLGAQQAAVAVIADPEVVKLVNQAGIGATLSVRLGGKVDQLHGDPLPVTATVKRLSDGRFTHTGPMLTGIEIDMGPTAVLELAGEQGSSVQVIVTTHRYQPTDLEVFRSQGIEPTEQKILAVKSLVHFRAAFTPIAKQIIEVDTPGLSSPHLDRLTFRHLKRPIYPFEPELMWAP